MKEPVVTHMKAIKGTKLPASPPPPRGTVIENTDGTHYTMTTPSIPDDGGPAYPQYKIDSTGQDIDTGELHLTAFKQPGISVRDYFASTFRIPDDELPPTRTQYKQLLEAMGLKSVLQQEDFWGWIRNLAEIKAAIRYVYADAMIDERKRSQNG